MAVKKLKIFSSPILYVITFLRLKFKPRPEASRLDPEMLHFLAVRHFFSVLESFLTFLEKYKYFFVLSQKLTGIEITKIIYIEKFDLDFCRRDKILVTKCSNRIFVGWPESRRHNF